MKFLSETGRMTALAAALVLAASGALNAQDAPKPAPTAEPQATAEPAAPTPTAEPQASAEPEAEEVQDALAAKANVPMTEIPFFADWASSPHADRSAEPFNHWNEEGAVEAACARCHSTPGFQDYIGADGTPAGVVDHPAPTGTVITCKACHNAATLRMTSVTFPSGAKIEKLGAEARCMTCHQGRESAESVNKAISGMDDDAVNDKLKFINVHYTAAGATLMGSQAHGAYEYPGQDYVGQLDHPAPFTTCITCHDMHSTKVQVSDCKACHKEVTDEASLQMIRASDDKADYDGDGNSAEGIGMETAGLKEMLYAAIQSYAKDTAGKPVAYDPHAYPYFFNDNNGDGKVGEDEAKFPNQYKAWTPRLLKAAYNYQFAQKDPGAFAHNGAYIVQILHDSIADLGEKSGVDASKLTRP